MYWIFIQLILNNIIIYIMKKRNTNNKLLSELPDDLIIDRLNKLYLVNLPKNINRKDTKKQLYNKLIDICNYESFDKKSRENKKYKLVQLWKNWASLESTKLTIDPNDPYNSTFEMFPNMHTYSKSFVGQDNLFAYKKLILLLKPYITINRLIAWNFIKSILNKNKIALYNDTYRLQHWTTVINMFNNISSVPDNIQFELIYLNLRSELFFRLLSKKELHNFISDILGNNLIKICDFLYKELKTDL